MRDLLPARKDREQLEQELLVELRAAERRFRSAAAEYEQMREKYGEMPAHPDGAHALHVAAARERAALEAYQRALKVFSDLAMSGRYPPAPEG